MVSKKPAQYLYLILALVLWMGPLACGATSSDLSDPDNGSTFIFTPDEAIVPLDPIAVFGFSCFEINVTNLPETEKAQWEEECGEACELIQNHVGKDTLGTYIQKLIEEGINLGNGLVISPGHGEDWARFFMNCFGFKEVP